MTIAWVLGGGGLLGSALLRMLRQNRIEPFVPASPLRWEDVAALTSQIADAVEAFSARLHPGGSWQIYWAAGVGTMSSSESDLAPEYETLSLLLRRLQATPRLMAASGAIAFASSAGAVYAGASDEVVTENTPVAPTNAYARQKLRQEELLRQFASTNGRTAILVARISTLYGPGQGHAKQQGLLAHIARSLLRNRAVNIYVPYDTMRDYIASDDAAAAMIAFADAIQAQPRVLIKIVASETPTTIAEIISIFKRLTRRPPRIVTSASRLSALYGRCVQYRSVAFPEGPRSRHRSLLVGITQLVESERAAFTSGRRPS